MTAPGALSGYRIVDLTTVLMAPMAARMLADHDADVVRVESLTGDSTRNGWPARNQGMSGFTLNLQRNKLSVAVDLKTPDGIEIVKRLVATADVVVTNMRQGALVRLGLDAATLQADRPELIHCRANGFGSGGPYAQRAAYDDAIQAASGLANLFERTNGEPNYVPAVIADKVCGLHIVHAVMAALLHRERTGEGQEIEVPMFETMVAFNLVEHHRGATFAPAIGPLGYDRLLTPHRKPVVTADGHMCIMPYTDANFRAFFTFAGAPELADDERFINHNSRIENVEALYEIVGELAHTHTTAEWDEFCADNSIPAAPMHDLADIDADPHISAVGLITEVEHPTEGNYNYVRDPISYSASPTGMRRHAPRLGEHTRSILRELGYDAAEIDDLIERSVVKAAEPTAD